MMKLKDAFIEYIYVCVLIMSIRNITKLKHFVDIYLKN